MVVYREAEDVVVKVVLVVTVAGELVGLDGAHHLGGAIPTRVAHLEGVRVRVRVAAGQG